MEACLLHHDIGSWTEAPFVFTPFVFFSSVTWILLFTRTTLVGILLAFCGDTFEFCKDEVHQLDLRPSDNRTATPTLGLCSYFPEEIIGPCKTSKGLSFFPPLHDHDVATIHLNALDTFPVGLSCLLIWPCFFGPFLNLFAGMHWSLSLGCMERLDLPRTVWPCFFAPFAEMPQSPGFHGTLFQSKCSLPCHRVFVNFDLRAAVGLGSRPVPEPRNLGNCTDLLVVLHTDQNLSRSFRSRTLVLVCPVDVRHLHLCLSSWKQASRTSSPRLDFGPYRNTKNHDPLTVGRLDFERLDFELLFFFFLTCCQKPIKPVPWHFLCWFSLT